jgi:hypothetical protein
MKVAAGARRVALAAALFLASAPASGRFDPEHALSAQTPGREPAVLELAPSARAAGLGHAYQLGARSADGLFYNPAVVDSARGILLGVQRFGDSTLGAAFAGSVAWWGGGAALGLQAMEYLSGSPVAGGRPGGSAPFFADGEFAVSELVATAAYARELFGFRVGAAAKLIDQRNAENRDATFAFDMGTARSVRRVTIGLAVRDLGPGLDIEGKARLPTRVTLGAGSYGLTLGPLDVGAAVAVTFRSDREIVGGGGVEVAYWPVTGRTFAGRVGLHGAPDGDGATATLGASYWGDNLVLEYALEPLASASKALHRFTLGWR